MVNESTHLLVGRLDWEQFKILTLNWSGPAYSGLGNYVLDAVNATISTSGEVWIFPGGATTAAFICVPTIYSPNLLESMCGNARCGWRRDHGFEVDETFVERMADLCKDPILKI